MKVVIVLAGLILAIGLCQGASACNTPFHPINGQGCYFMGDEPEDYYYALARCQFYAGHLVEVESFEEQNDLAVYLSSFGRNVWLGMTDVGFQSWRWTYTDKPVNQFHWGGNEPDSGGTQKCAVMFSFFNFLWADLDCSSNPVLVYALCEQNQ